MDKDLASAILLERCQCYNKSLDSAKKVLAKPGVAPAELLWARRIVKALGEVFLSQRFMDRAMELSSDSSRLRFCRPLTASMRAVTSLMMPS